MNLKATLAFIVFLVAVGIAIRVLVSQAEERGELHAEKRMRAAQLVKDSEASKAFAEALDKKAEEHRRAIAALDKQIEDNKKWLQTAKRLKPDESALSLQRDFAALGY